MWITLNLTKILIFRIYRHHALLICNWFLWNIWSLTLDKVKTGRAVWGAGLWKIFNKLFSESSTWLFCSTMATVQPNGLWRSQKKVYKTFFMTWCPRLYNCYVNRLRVYKEKETRLDNSYVSWSLFCKHVRNWKITMTRTGNTKAAFDFSHLKCSFLLLVI